MGGRVYIKRRGSIHLIELDFLFMSILAGSEIRFFLALRFDCKSFFHKKFLKIS